MRRTTCRNALIFVAAMCLGLMVTSARGGSSLDSPAAPTNPAGAMWTLNDIYNVLDTRTTNVTKRTVVFTEPTSGPTNGTMHTLNEIMTLVTNRAPRQKTGVTASSVPYDAGWYSTNFGVAWPTPRFSPVVPSGDGTNQIRDNLTGLIWARDANIFGVTNWSAAVTNCNNLTYGGTNDWRMPNIRELMSLVSRGNSYPPLPSGHPFINVKGASNSDRYWLSTTAANDSSAAFIVYMDFGGMAPTAKTSTYYAWPVRGGQ